MGSSIMIADKSFNQQEVNAATSAIIGFIGSICESADVADLVYIAHDQLQCIWHIFDNNVRNNIIVTAFAEYDIDITPSA